jgi:hypothetical protein
MTAQFSDLLVYEGELLSICCEPLKPYLETIKLPHKLKAPNSACWRGYVAKWAIDNNKLFLIKWEGYILDYLVVHMDYIFPDEEVVFAKWFTGEIRIPQGEMLQYIHAGYASVYEGNLCLNFVEGVLIKKEIIWLTESEIEAVYRDIEEQRNLPF